VNSLNQKNPDALLASLQFNAEGLIAAIAQQQDSGEVLMMAWMNADSIRETLETGRVCYWSRTRKGLWRKGESSGQVQELVELRVDCDADTLLLIVKQTGPACHTGRRACFFKSWTESGLTENQPVLIPPEKLYGDE